MKKVLLILIGYILIVMFWPFKKLVGNQKIRLKKSYAEDPASISDGEAYLVLKDLAWEEYKCQNYAKSKDYATELLRLNKIVEGNWNYGNAIHHAHTILGLISLHSDQLNDAKEHLALSSKTPGSPQLDSFGPDLSLAQMLIDRGEGKSVKKFLLNCGKFWEMDNGKLSEWVKTIDAGGELQFYNKKRT